MGWSSKGPLIEPNFFEIFLLDPARTLDNKRLRDYSDDFTGMASVSRSGFMDTIFESDEFMCSLSQLAF
jgi:hypothetical protein